MARIERTIPRRERGTLATLINMAAIAKAGQEVRLAAELGPDDLDETLRALWFYVPDGPVETIRTIDRMQREYHQVLEYPGDGTKPYTIKPAGLIAGDCDDAATFAAAVLLHARSAGDRRIGNIYFVGARPWDSIEFKHVFLMFDFRGRLTRVDPTAPHDANYTLWETLVFEV